jgi:hypothetical protein
MGAVGPPDSTERVRRPQRRSGLLRPAAGPPTVGPAVACRDNISDGGVWAPGGLRRLQSGWDGRSPSGGFDSRPPPPIDPWTSGDVLRKFSDQVICEITLAVVRGRSWSVTQGYSQTGLEMALLHWSIEGAGHRV